VDLERREVVDVLPDRSTASISAWLEQRPEIEVVSRDRCGSYAQGAQEGAPQAHQVADRFHMLQNLRGAVQTQLSRAGSSARPLLPTDDADGDCDPTISCSPRDNHGGAEHRHIVRMAKGPESIWRHFQTILSRMLTREKYGCASTFSTRL
jgi:transposase